MLRTIVVLLLLSVGCGAESKFNNQVQPGLTTRSEVDRVLGAPLRVSGATCEYRPPAGAAKLVIKYVSVTGVVETVEAIFLKPYSRGGMIQALRLPDSPMQTTVGKDGKLEEFFGSPAYLVLSYAAADTASGVSSIVYHSSVSFERLLTTKVATPASQPSAPLTSPTKVPPKPPPLAASVITPGPRSSLHNLPPSSSSPASPAPKVTPGPRGVAPKAASPTPLMPEAAPSTRYAGPTTGVLNWSGKVERDQLIPIEGLPGIPVMIDFNDREFSVVEPPSPSNGWKRLVVRSRKASKASIAVRWSVIQ